MGTAILRLGRTLATSAAYGALAYEAWKSVPFAFCFMVSAPLLFSYISYIKDQP